MLKKILFPLVAMFMLAGCATPPTTIEVSPKITLPQQDPSLMGVTVSAYFILLYFSEVGSHSVA